MSAEWTPKVGDRVTGPTFAPGTYEITAVGRQNVLAVNENDLERFFLYGDLSPAPPSLLEAAKAHVGNCGGTNWSLTEDHRTLNDLRAAIEREEARS